MERGAMKFILMLFLLMLLAAPVSAQDSDVEAELRRVYTHMAELLGEDNLDVDAFIAYTKNHYTDDAKVVSLITDRKTGRTTPVENNKQELIDMMPESYGHARDNKTAINIESIDVTPETSKAQVVYNLSYEATLHPKDEYGVTYEQKMAMDSQCTDLLRQNEGGIFQIYSSTCNAAVDYGQQKIYVGDGDSGAE